jgi:hypothetical protein
LGLELGRSGLQIGQSEHLDKLLSKYFAMLSPILFRCKLI